MNELYTSLADSLEHLAAGYRTLAGSETPASPATAVEHTVTVEEVRAVLAACPAELLLFETDCPYLTPEPYRGQRNNPAYTELVVKNAAALRGTTPEELADQSTRNAHTLFTKLQ